MSPPEYTEESVRDHIHQLSQEVSHIAKSCERLGIINAQQQEVVGQLLQHVETFSNVLRGNPDGTSPGLIEQMRTAHSGIEQLLIQQKRIEEDLQKIQDAGRKLESNHRDTLNNIRVLQKESESRKGWWKEAGVILLCLVLTALFNFLFNPNL